MPRLFTGTRGSGALSLFVALALSAGCGAPPATTDTAPPATRTADPGAQPLDPAELQPLLALGSQVTCWLHAEVPATSSIGCIGRPVLQALADSRALARARGLTLGLRHGCLLREDGEVACWGDGLDGQLGVVASRIPERHLGRPARESPEPVPGAPVLAALEAGWLHTCGLTPTGAVFCWGDDARGQLGRAEAGPEARAVEGLPDGVFALAAGGLHTCIVTAEGRVQCWGDGSFGQLGDGEAADARSPVEVSGLAGAATAVAAGGYHTCARLADGSVSCWGDNRFGQLGDGTTERRLSAVTVDGLAAPARAIAAGGVFTCALLEDGRVQCWGSDEMGELGDGEPAGDSSPPRSRLEPAAPVGRLPGPAARVMAGELHACAEITPEGGPPELYCWGVNDSGQLGDGTTELRQAAVRFEGVAADLADPAIPAPSPPFEGLDVSYHSGRVDWRAAAAEGFRFGLMLATAGVDFRDPFLTAHWEHIRDAGLVRGAYHFYVSADDPEEQAHHFLSHVLLEPGDLRPVVDIESASTQAPGELADQLAVFVAEIESVLGVGPIIYTGPTFWRDHVADPRFAAYPLWIAEYGVDAPVVPDPWDRWHLWQWRGNADLPHVSPVVDLDRVHAEVDFDALRMPETRP
ncbi:MAG TPA: GH25 family lysozyme [Thermoanaerobaculia bacterium]|nr:GH25 family lysozyme [Thermoanaerobaculia bacterium]